LYLSITSISEKILKYDRYWPYLLMKGYVSMNDRYAGHGIIRENEHSYDESLLYSCNLAKDFLP